MRGTALSGAALLSIRSHNEIEKPLNQAHQPRSVSIGSTRAHCDQADTVPVKETLSKITSKMQQNEIRIFNNGSVETDSKINAELECFEPS